MPGLKCFIAAVIGGIGNIKGAVLGGFILWPGRDPDSCFFPQLSGYRDAFAFIVLIVILFYKPTGLLGEKRQKLTKMKKKDVFLTLIAIAHSLALPASSRPRWILISAGSVNLCLVYGYAAYP